MLLAFWTSSVQDPWILKIRGRLPPILAKIIKIIKPDQTSKNFGVDQPGPTRTHRQSRNTSNPNLIKDYLGVPFCKTSFSCAILYQNKPNHSLKLIFTSQEMPVSTKNLAQLKYSTFSHFFLFSIDILWGFPFKNQYN